MTTLEFSDEFDTLLDSYRRFKDFDDKENLDSIEFNEYEKSVFLTKAQEQIVIELYTGRTEKGSSFENTEEFRAYLRNLISTVELTEEQGDSIGLSDNSKFYHLPDNVLFITYEAAVLGDDAECKSGITIPVIPTTQDEYHSIAANPFKWANKRRALRLDLSQGGVELISKYNIAKYIVRYLRRPQPIILFRAEEVAVTGASINGHNNISECELEPILHRPILERAILLALQSKNISPSKG